MAVTRTSRFKLHRWDSGSDPINRAQSDLDNLQVETLAAIFREGLDADKGVASDSANVKSFYNATDTAILYYSNGSSWVPVNDYGEAGDISTATLATAASAGVSSEIARADHVHAMGTPATPTSITTASAATGSSSTPARSDHVHDLANDSVTATKIASGSVTEAKIGSAAVTEAKIGTGAVTETKIGALAVTEAKIGSLAVTEGKIGTGAVTPLKIGSTIVGSGASAGGLQRNGTTGVLSVLADSTTISVNGSGQVSITSGGVGATQLASNAVVEAKIATAAVTPLKIASTIVGSGASAGGLQRNVGTGVLSVLVDSTTVSVNGSGQVGITSGGVGATQLASNSVVEAKIQDAAVTPLKVASTIVGSGASAGGLQRSGVTGVLSVLTDSSTVTVNGSGQIAVGTITNSNITNGTISPLKLTTAVAGNGISRDGTSGALSVTGGAGITVDGTGVYIGTSAVVEGMINAGAVIEGKIGTGAVTEDKIGTGAVTEGKIGTGAVTPLKIGSGIVGTGALAGGLQRNGITGVLSVLADSSTIAINGSGQIYIPTNGVGTTQINGAAVTGAKAGAGVYRNVNSLTTGGRIEFTTVASLPTVGSALAGSYTNGDIIFGY